MKTLISIVTVAALALGSLAALACPGEKSTTSTKVETGTKVLKPKA